MIPLYWRKQGVSLELTNGELVFGTVDGIVNRIIQEQIYVAFVTVTGQTQIFDDLDTAKTWCMRAAKDAEFLKQSA